MQRDYSEIGLWKDVPKAQWEDWRWQVSHRVVTEETLEQIVRLTPEETVGIKKCL